MIEKEISRISKGKGKSRVVQDDGADAEEAELRKMGVTGLIAMIEIWMSDLWYVSSSCDPHAAGVTTQLSPCGTLVVRKADSAVWRQKPNRIAML